MAKDLLNGVLPPRPLCLPIVFSLGAKVENVEPDAYRSNPTKIVNALRKIRAALRADCATCYFDPFLEVEALGGMVRRGDGERPSIVTWPRRADPGGLPEGLCSPEGIVQRGRVPVAIEVIRRMNSLPRRDFLLMAGVSGPMTLAARISGFDSTNVGHNELVSEAAKEFSAAATTQVSTAFLEAGADVILIHEEIFPSVSAEESQAWADLLAPAINVVRFYEALPVLQLTEAACVLANWDTIVNLQRDCAVCIPLEAATAKQGEKTFGAHDTTFGIALPVEMFQPNESISEAAFAAAQTLLADRKPAVISTAGDAPPQTDMKRLTQVLVHAAGAA